MQITRPNHRAAKPVRGTWEYRLIFMASFPVFLVTEIVGRTVRTRRAVASPAGHSKSIFAAARESANTSLPYAFLG
jgi:hypothetical protein